MKAILEFNLDDCEDKIAHLRAVKAVDMALVIWEIDQYLRNETKYAPDSMPVEVFNKLQDVKGKLRQFMLERSIDLDELIN